ncbi:MAG: hypothetical protein WCC87_09350 [Candidatus Korobacteraceae bacterium]
MANDELRQKVESWVDQCRLSIASASGLPYLDGDYEILDAHVPIHHSETDDEAVCSYELLAKDFLARNPSDLAVRFALLYPLRKAGMRFSAGVRGASPQVKATFDRLVELCSPERLADIRDLKFELHNSYLAKQWDNGARILQRIAVIGALGAAEISALRGHYLFLSVWGCRIEWEMGQLLDDYPEGHDCFWPSGLQWKHKRVSDLRSFARPELIAPGSDAHWILTAWSTNPRNPKPINFQPELDFTTPAVPPNERDYRDASLRHYIQDLYRDFDPVAQPTLNEAEIERLQHARINLADTVASSPGLAPIYRPVLARTMFSLGQFELAAMEYQTLCDEHPAFSYNLEMLDGSFQEQQEEYQWEISFMTALCHKLGGNFGDALQVLERLRSSEHHAAGAAWWAAKWYTEGGNYQEAAELLEKELSLRFSPPDSWELSTILALAKVLELHQDSGEFMQRLRRDYPELQSLLLGVCVQLWPNIRRLSSDSLDHWLHAAFELHAFERLPAAGRIAANSAIKDYGWILEGELRTGVFDVFRNSVINNNRLRDQARMDAREYRSDKFFKFLIAKDPEVSLGTMLGAFEDCRNSVIPTHLQFANFLDSTFPQLLSAFQNIAIVNDHRDRASHPKQVFDKAAAVTVARACRDSLEPLWAAGEQNGCIRRTSGP